MDGDTLLQDAVHRSSARVLAILLRRAGHAKYARNHSGETVLDTALMHGSRAHVHVVLSRWHLKQYEWIHMFKVVGSADALRAVMEHQHGRRWKDGELDLIRIICKRRRLDLALVMVERMPTHHYEILKRACDLAWEELTQAVLERIDDETLYREDSCGNTMLSLWCVNSSSSYTTTKNNIVRLLLERWSNERLYQWRSKDAGGGSLLHLVTSTRTSSEVFELVLNRWTDNETLYGVNEDNQTVLYSLCDKDRYRQGWVTGKRPPLLDRWVHGEHPAYGTADDHTQQTALHVCCRKGMTDTASTLYQRMTPEQRLVRDKNGNTAQQLLAADLHHLVFPTTCKSAIP